jgi:hypothetical protein
MGVGDVGEEDAEESIIIGIDDEPADAVGIQHPDDDTSGDEADASNPYGDCDDDDLTASEIEFTNDAFKKEFERLIKDVVPRRTLEFKVMSAQGRAEDHSVELTALSRVERDVLLRALLSSNVDCAKVLITYAIAAATQHVNKNEGQMMNASWKKAIGEPAREKGLSTTEEAARHATELATFCEVYDATVPGVEANSTGGQ